MKWHGKELNTAGQVCNALRTIHTQEDADTFMAGMRKEGPEHAGANVGYIIGYMNAEDRERLYKLLGVVHPASSGWTWPLKAKGDD